jgi:DnaK suppressor protein
MEDSIMNKGAPSTSSDVKALLHARRAEILALIDGHGDDSQPVELDQTRVGRLSRMDALQNQAMAKETERRRHQELERIDLALERLANDEYGDCLACGEPIAEKRLKLDPSATLCIDCAAAQSV